MKDLLEKIVKNILTVSTAAKVTAVDKEKGLCSVEPLNGGAEILDVQLSADQEASNGQKLLPKIGSIVLVAPIDNDRSSYYLAMFSELSEASWKIADTVISLSDKGIVIGKGKDSLQAILNDLVIEILKIYAPMNKLGLIAVQKRIKEVLKHV